MRASPKQVTEIDAGRHPVVIGTHTLEVLDQRLVELAPSQTFIVGDENTLRHCLAELLAHVPSLRNAETISVQSGEGAKSVGVCQDIWQHLVHRAADRRSVVVNLGGGVVTDLGGFIAGTFKRGLRYINVPTSLMGMVDAAIGGKTGIDLAGVKNVVGVFHDPLAVHIHVPFLKSLGKRDLLNGIAEMVKHGLVRDAAHWEAIAAAPLHDIDALSPLVQASAAVKCAIVKEDPREEGVRKLLNFGHTIGHGIEAYSWESQHRALLHGEAVAIGMISEAWLSWRMGHLSRMDYDRITHFLLTLYRPFLLDGAADHRVVEIMRNDKKNTDGQFRFTLLTGIGSAVVDVPVTVSQAQEALEHYRLLVRDGGRSDHS